MKLDPDLAARFARIALGHVTREYPHKLDHVLHGDEEALPPRALHPIFFGSFDWHSCVHGWWSLLTLRRLFPANAEAADIAALANHSFTAEKVAAELAYLGRPMSAGFERPYGWGWLLYLHLEVSRHQDRNWAGSLEPLARAFAAFPVMAAAIGVPLLIQGYGGDPAVVGAIGMLAGFCGTLMTPMAANFNIVPAALLELKDRNGVIKAQIGTALPLLVVNILFIWWFAFR